jgi:hypothetical protein
MLVFVGTVALFSWLFAVVGRRGYGESQTVHSLTIARALGGGRCDAMQWISAFATRGAIYTLTHDAPSSYYSAVPQTDAVRGRIYNGREGRFLIDIPLYSARPFIHRAVMQGDDTSVTVEKWESQTHSSFEFALKPGTGFPREVVAAFVQHLDELFTLSLKHGRWVADHAHTHDSLANALRSEVLQPLTNARFRNREEENPDEVLRKLLPLLQARALGGTDAFHQSIPERRPPQDQAQLWVFARAPEGFRTRGAASAREHGYVLYVQDIFRK